MAHLPLIIQANSLVASSAPSTSRRSINAHTADGDFYITGTAFWGSPIAEVKANPGFNHPSWTMPTTTDVR